MGRTKKVLVAFLAAVAVIAAASGVTSCEKYFLPSLELSQETILVNKASQELSLVVNSNAAWSVKSYDADWLDLSPGRSESTATLRISISANESGETRSVTVSIETETLSRKLVVSQSADDELPEN